MIAAWREQGWPEQRMSFEHWDALADLALGGGTGRAVRDFPGTVRASQNGARLTLRRIEVTP